MNRELYRAVAVVIFLIVPFLISGCVKLGPDFKGIDNPPIPKKWRQNHKTDSLVVNWWESFHDKSLNTLIDKAYGQNLDIQSAALRIVQARAALGFSKGLLFPQSQKLSAKATTTKSNLVDIQTYGVNFDLGWEIDIWGKYARGVESTEALLYASVASYDNIMVSILAEVARSYIGYRTAQERLIYAQRNVAIQKRVVNMTQIQYNAGNVSNLDTQQAKTQLYNTKSTIPILRLAKIKARNALALLLNEDANKIEKILQDKKVDRYTYANNYIEKHKGIIQLKSEKLGFSNVSIVPKAKLKNSYKIDANLITRRPDIKVAEYNVHANSAKIGAKEAQLYPSFTLFGNVGFNNSNQTGAWLSGNEPISVTIGPSFSWNIFNYGRIRDQIRIQDAKFEESLVRYNKAVLLAVRDISNALSGYRLTQEQLAENKKALEATIKAFNISVIRYNEGVMSYQRLLSSIEKLTIVQDRYASIKGDVALNAIMLYKSLGGGWQLSRGKSYISPSTAKRMKKRTKWGSYLDKDQTILPKGFYDEQ
ncbi:putative outer membrane protein [hydrothermal vent metagenome]|uniref:Putative outer membrane protein n=1 Tax=hydrothermal vent metagenome TaxID=652676 RepID=A0A1W1BYA4_9ZZZZ